MSHSRAPEIACVLCGQMDAIQLYYPTRSPGPVVRCRMCGLIYISPRVNRKSIIESGPVLVEGQERLRNSNNLADIQNSWELPIITSKELELPALQQNHIRALRRIERYRKPGNLLDFGCGGGFFMRSARARGWKVFGLEPLPAHAIYARATSGAEVINDILREESYPKDHFDVITAFQVFEHLPDPANILRLLTGFLKPGGLILIEVPNIDTWTVKLLGKRHRHFVSDHLYFFSAKTLEKMLRQAGLTTLSTTFPTRTMTLRHAESWINRAAGRKWVERIFPGNPSQPRMLNINLGDIIEVIAQKKV